MSESSALYRVQARRRSLRRPTGPAACRRSGTAPAVRRVNLVGELVAGKPRPLRERRSSMHTIEAQELESGMTVRTDDGDIFLAIVEVIEEVSFTGVNMA